MAKKKNNTDNEEQQRQTRKEVLIARKHAEEQRKVRIVVGAVVGLLAALFIFAIVDAYIISPNRPVAEINGAEISLADWQEEVRFQRAQYINLLENQLDAFNGDVGTVQQFSGQAITELATDQGSEDLGQRVLNTMLEDTVIAEEAAARGISVSEEEIDEEIGAAFNYFGGELPTAFPTPTETVEPTPSITPIPTQVITEVLPTNTPFPTATAGPTNTPFPTATAVSEEAFREEWGEVLAGYTEVGITEEQYREYLRKQLLRQKLADAIAEEQELATEADHASFFFIITDNEAEANETAAMIANDDFLTVWNTVRSTPFDPEAETPSSAFASEVMWQTREEVASNLGEEASVAIFDTPIGEPSAVITRAIDAETTQYILVMTSGRELRPLTEAAIQQAKVAALTSYIDQKLTGALTTTGYSEGRTPKTPRLDQKFLAQPTAAPEQPTLPPVPVEEGE